MIRIYKQKVLVPTDFSVQADAAVMSALAMSEDPADVSVIHVAPPTISYPVADPAIVWESVAEETRSRVIKESFRRHIKNPRAEQLDFHVSFGSPAEEIVAYAEEKEIDLIMLPSHGRSGLKRLLLGSVTDRVVHAAHCAVLVLRSEGVGRAHAGPKR